MQELGHSFRPGWGVVTQTWRSNEYGGQIVGYGTWPRRYCG